jgi:hypothetical protein
MTEKKDCIVCFEPCTTFNYMLTPVLCNCKYTIHRECNDMWQEKTDRVCAYCRYEIYDVIRHRQIVQYRIQLTRGNFVLLVVFICICILFFSSQLFIFDENILNVHKKTEYLSALLVNYFISIYIISCILYTFFIGSKVLFLHFI